MMLWQAPSEAQIIRTVQKEVFFPDRSDGNVYFLEVEVQVGIAILELT